MLISRNWLQAYFKEELPSAEKLAELFTFHAFEVEGVDKTENDEILDLKILPDRAHYALSHLGIAREVSAITGMKMQREKIFPVPASKINKLSISITDNELCRRYMGRRANGVDVVESPAWLKERLESIGARSINSIVDATNFVMFDLGQPLHAFDADKVEGGIDVRLARKGEKIDLLPEKTVTVDGKVVYKERSLELKGNELVIADDKGPLALAGIKGGMRAVVTKDTKNIIIESANFNPANIRRTSTYFNVRNDSSKRFENEISSELAAEAMEKISSLIAKLSPEVVFGEVVDVYQKPTKFWSISTSSDEISSLLGVSISEGEITDILGRLDIKSERQGGFLVLTIPYWRLDITISKDIAEEVGRIYGYDKIKPASLPESKEFTINKVFYWSMKIKHILADLGYSEVYTYSLTSGGEVKILNPLASDKGYVRANLAEGLGKASELNIRNAALLGLSEIKIFEMGNVFTKGEKEHLSLGLNHFSVKNIKNRDKLSADAIQRAVNKIAETIGVEIKCEPIIGTGATTAINLSEIIEKLPEPKKWDIDTNISDVVYKPFSQYPFAVRDIAVFVPEGVKESEPLSIIDAMTGGLVVRIDLFDVFQKEGKTSYAFRLVFQSFEKTLTDAEINEVMEKITGAMSERNGWQVR